MRRLSRHVGTTIFFSITLALLVLVGLDVQLLNFSHEQELEFLE